MSTHTIYTHALFDEEPYQQQFTARVLAVSELGVALDQTLFYPTGGGQPGDKGYFLLPDKSVVEVVNTQRDSHQRSIIWHQLKDEEAAISVGMDLQGNINWERRYQHMRMHTCLHLLCSIINAPVTGCSIGTDKGRLDFDLLESSLDKKDITYKLNELVNSALEVTVRNYSTSQYSSVLDMTRTKAVTPPITEGMVRMVDISDLNIQPCGGTHVRNTHEVGNIVCDKIEKKSRHNRRVTLRFT